MRADGRAAADEEAGIPLLDRGEIGLKALLEERHWWYRGRRRIVLDAVELLRRRLPADPSVLDVGCGSGAMLAHLNRAVGPATGVDVNPRVVEHARGRGLSSVSVAGVEQLPFPEGAFELVTCLDVLEHVPDDRGALAELRRVTAAHGLLLVTVPAYPSLWSGHDVAAGHVRRYRAGELGAAAQSEGWRPVLETHFNALLLPLVVCARMIARARRVTPRSDLLATPRWIDPVLEAPLRLEAAVIRRGRTLPAGLSLLAAFENPAADG
jgi:ubiquinone/menaquinone biosynthesis C-methylase UbiE